MHQTALSVLCGEPMWMWDSETGGTIRFKDNGIGELVLRLELGAWILAEFEWRALNPEDLNSTVDTSYKMEEGSSVISQFDIQMTLTKRRLSELYGHPIDLSSYRINEDRLIEDAFCPKTYNIRIEKGKFTTDYHSQSAYPGTQVPKFSLRLAFDNSPYPPRQQWKDANDEEYIYRFWERKNFCARKLPDEEGSVATTPNVGSRCVIF